MSGSPTSLYRLYDSLGNLLYVGIASNVGRRMNAHAKTQPWWWQVASIAVEHHPGRRAAEAAELATIQSERPPFNVVGAVGRAPRCKPLALNLAGRDFVFTEPESFWHIAKAIEEAVALEPEIPDALYLLWREAIRRYLSALQRSKAAA